MQLFGSTKLLNLTTTEPTKQPYIARKIALEMGAGGSPYLETTSLLCNC